MRLLFSLLLLLAPARHAYHASITELRYNAAGKQLEVSIKVFTDDFEKALSKGQVNRVSLGMGGPLPGMLTSAYLQRTFQVKTSAGVLLPLQFLGLQPEKDAYWLYCKVALPKAMSGMQLRNAILLDAFPDQANVVNVEAGRRRAAPFSAAGTSGKPWLGEWQNGYPKLSFGRNLSACTTKQRPKLSFGVPDRPPLSHRFAQVLAQRHQRLKTTQHVAPKILLAQHIGIA